MSLEAGRASIDGGDVAARIDAVTDTPVRIVRDDQRHRHQRGDQHRALGRLADRMGHKAAFLGGSVLFATRFRESRPSKGAPFTMRPDAGGGTIIEVVRRRPLWTRAIGVPPLLLALTIQRYLVRGLSFGAVKA